MGGICPLGLILTSRLRVATSETGMAPDIGADEYRPPGVLKYIYLPLVTK